MHLVRTRVLRPYILKSSQEIYSKVLLKCCAHAPDGTWRLGLGIPIFPATACSLCPLSPRFKFDPESDPWMTSLACWWMLGPGTLVSSACSRTKSIASPKSAASRSGRAAPGIWGKPRREPARVSHRAGQYPASVRSDFVQGTVKRFNAEQGYGFISRTDGPDVFVYHSEIDGYGFRSLEENQHVEFEVAKGATSTRRNPSAARDEGGPFSNVEDLLSPGQRLLGAEGQMLDCLNELPITASEGNARPRRRRPDDSSGCRSAERQYWRIVSVEDGTRRAPATLASAQRLACYRP